MRVAAVQFQHKPGDLSGNLQRVVEFVENGAVQGVELIVFPECCLTGYWHLRNLSRSEIVDIAELVPSGSGCQTVTDLAVRHQMTIGVGLVEMDDQGNLYNAFFVVKPDRTWVNHRKLHCFISPHLQSGDQYTVFDMPGGRRCGVLTCYDNNIGENVRITALMGAEILIAPHQTGGCDSGSPGAMGVIDTILWDDRADRHAELTAACNGDKGRGWLMRWLPARAHDNGVFIIFSNGVGRDDNEVRTGNSMILDPYGRILQEAHEPLEQMVVARLDFSIRERSTGARWIQARRPELYKLLTEKTGREKDTRKVRFDHLRE